MPVCLFCQLDNRDPSAEHVIADGLGGCIELPRAAVCKKCNNAINEAIDRAVQRDLLPLLAQLGIVGKRGKIPKWLVTENVDGEERRLRIDHEAVAPAEGRKLLAQSENTYEFRANSVEELTKARDDLAARNPGKAVEMEVTGPHPLNLPEQRIDYIDFTPEHWSRWAAKTALNSICHVLGQEATLAPALDDLRQHALSGGPLKAGLTVGGIGGEPVDDVESVLAEHRIVVEVVGGTLVVKVTLFGFCGLSLTRPTERLVDIRREIILDAADKRIVRDTAAN